jgi:uncharacterized membrane protein
MSSHFGMVILVIVGAATVLGVIIAAVFETRHADKGNPASQQPGEKNHR